jgi:hypothetical protein
MRKKRSAEYYLDLGMIDRNEIRDSKALIKKLQDFKKTVELLEKEYHEMIEYYHYLKKQNRDLVDRYFPELSYEERVKIRIQYLESLGNHIREIGTKKNPESPIDTILNFSRIKRDLDYYIKVELRRLHNEE